MSLKQNLLSLGFALCVAGSVSISAYAAPAQAVRLASQATLDFYKSAPSKKAWNNDAAYDALIAEIASLQEHGLNPEHYDLTELERVRSDKTAREPIATGAWLLAAAHMTYGKLDPLTVEPDWTAAGRQIDLVAALKTTLETQSVGGSLQALAPKQAGYAALKAEYSRLRMAGLKGLMRVPAGETLKPNMRSARVGLVQARLVELELLTDVYTAELMDVPTVQAVKVFQDSVNLDNDGAVGPVTLRALNRGSDDKLQQLAVNLERWRWLPDDLGRRHLRANIAGFDVTAWNEGRVERTHLTMVGKTYRKTPVFSDAVSYMDFNPWWETPNSLATKDKLPLFKRDPGAVKRLGFQVLDRSGAVVDSSTINWADVSATRFPYRLRQAPGETNAMGRVKIMFPNVHNVYLHDTPSRGLFSQRQRAFSSGCLRTQDPIGLSEWLLSETPDWTRARIDAALASGKETRARLSEKVPVHILYFTAVAEVGGAVRFLDDIYDRDAAVLAGLRATSQ